MILVLGKNGQLGFAMEQVFREKGDEVVSFGKDVVDITNPIEIRRIVEKYSPNIIINCAAYNQVEIAPSNIDQAFKVNAFGPFWIAQAAEAVNALFIHISTDYVFDGKKESYREIDCPHPINVYGVSKLAGEQLVLSTCKKSMIIRTSSLFGSRGNGENVNFVASMLKQSRERDEVSVVSDQFTSPSFTNDVAKVIYEIVARGGENGIYHLTNSGSCSWYEFAKVIFDIAGIHISVKPITTKESGTQIQRPKYSVLENYRLTTMGISPLPHWKDALRVYLSNK